MSQIKAIKAAKARKAADLANAPLGFVPPKAQPKVRFIKADGLYKVGDVIAPFAAQREYLLRRGVVELVDGKPAKRATPAAPAYVAPLDLI